MSKRHNSQPTLLSFVRKRPKNEFSSSEIELCKESEQEPSKENPEKEGISEASVVNSSEKTEIMDLGNYLKEDSISRETKLELLNNLWVPDELFQFPATTFGKKKLRFQRQWFSRFSWLAYTKTDGALCKYCVLFANECSGKGSHQKLKCLVTEPFRNWKHALEIFNAHSANTYHRNAVIVGSNFSKICHNSNLDVRNALDESRKKQVEENRRKLIPIIETIKFCGRQGLALRGTNDSGLISDEEPKINDGNFRALLRMRLKCGDKDLSEHMENMALNASYMSPKIQNEIIAICGNLLQKKIVNEIKDAQYFSILVDETMDISKLEQLSICVRYALEENNIYSLKEDFLCFIDVEKTTGEALAGEILSALRALNIDCDYLVGQGYDGAAAMKGSFNGVQAIIREKYPEALYVHCCSHSLNLALCHACKISAVRNCIGTIKAVGNFFRSSAKRTKLLKENIKAEFPESKWTTLIPMCETRWVENHDGLIRFREIYKCLVSTLEELSYDSDTEVSSKSLSFLKSILCSEFIISLCSLALIFSYTLTVCKLLQSPSCDLFSAMEHIENIHTTFKNVRKNIEENFSKIFLSASELLKNVNEEIRLPRIAVIQRQRSNIDTKDPEQYYRIAVAIPLLDDFISQLNSRFLDHKNIMNSFYTLIPTVCCDKSLDVQDFKVYDKRINSDLLEAEFEIWKTKWSKISKTCRPSCPIEALNECSRDLFPNMHALFRIFVTLPVTTCTPERTFSTLKRLKTYLRNSCGQERLTGLALMSVHRDVDIDNEEIITTFAMEKARKLDFIL